MGGNGMMWGGTGGWMVLHLIFWVLLVVGLVLLALWAVRKVSAGAGASGESSMDILKKRYARGELSREEYEEKKRDIS
ncbi:MAG: SHOCT domain-containing protein [Desulfobacteria bacterium]